MSLFAVDFLIEPDGREVAMDVEASTSKDAMAQALSQLELRPGELLHTIFAHIGRPSQS